MKEEPLLRTMMAERIKILGYIQIIVRRPEIAEDIFQDVCVLALEKRNTIKDEKHLMAWLRKTARYEAFNKLRKRQEGQLSLDVHILELLEDDWQEQEHQDTGALVAALRKCIKLLSPQARNLVERRYARNVSYADLARELKRPLSSLYVAFSRIHTSLADCVAKHTPPEGGDHG